MALPRCLPNFKARSHYFVLIHWDRVTHNYMRQLTGSSMFQIITCRLFSLKPLSETMLFTCLIAHASINFRNSRKYEHFNSRKCEHFHSRNCVPKYRHAKWWPFYLGSRVLNVCSSKGLVFPAALLYIMNVMLLHTGSTIIETHLSDVIPIWSQNNVSNGTPFVMSM